jgi:predicted unusual protein kinase regulating ubiquinone biosynthesis (AarF/ABC1/UbiB family)
VLELPVRLARYGAVAALLLRHRHAFDADAGRPADTGASADAERLAADLEQLGPTFVKLGQLLSTRTDLLPAAYTDALSRLQDDLEPIPYEEVERTVEGELGVRISKAFGLFERKPVAAASLGQVHCAALRDGRLVAVKVQRPGIDERVRADLETMSELAAWLDRRAAGSASYEWGELVDAFGKATLDELDYRHEAANLKTLARHLAGFDAIVVPQPVDDYTTGRVITMDYVLGTKVTALSPLARLDIDGEHLGRELVRAYLHQIIIHGFFHADPHPGNVFLTDDRRIALIDLGLVGHLSPRVQDRLLELMLVAADGRGDQAADVLLDLGERRDRFDEAAMRRDIVELVSRYQHVALADLQLGHLLLQANQAAGAHGLKPPADLAVLGKTLLNLDQVARALAPNLDVTATIRDEAMSLMRRRLLDAASPSGMLASLIETKHFAERLPARISRVIDALAANDLRLKVEVIDEGAVIDGLQKVANRIALGLVLAALIVAAALMMQVPTGFRLLGYPGVAIILLAIAGAASAALAVQIVTHDR